MIKRKKDSEEFKEWARSAEKRVKSGDYGDMATQLYTETSQSSNMQQHFKIEWQSKDLVFGELSFYKDDGKWICDSEAMTPEFVQHVVLNWLKSVKIK